MRYTLALLLTLFASSAQADPGFPLSEADKQVRAGKILIAREHPDVLRNVFRNDGFGGAGSRVIAGSMLSTSPAHIKAAREAMVVERHGQGMWLIRFPYVNVALIETKRGLVLFDTGYAAVGAVMAEVIPTLSAKPLTHIIVSHIHIDHAYGWPALKAKWPRAKTVTSDLFPAMAAKEVRLGGSIGRYQAFLQNSGPFGRFSLEVDNTFLPFASGAVPAIAGQAYFFQCWHRDANPNVTSNLSEGRRITWN